MKTTADRSNRILLAKIQRYRLYVKRDDLQVSTTPDGELLVFTGDLDARVINVCYCQRICRFGYVDRGVGLVGNISGGGEGRIEKEIERFTGR